jgi:uncharacterized delta-60 repeat protein
MGWSSKRISVGLGVLIALTCVGALTPPTGVAARPSRETSPSRFRSVAREPNGDLVLEVLHRTSGRDQVREIEMRKPRGALDPSFGKGGRVKVEGGVGLATLGDGDVLVGAHRCDGAGSSAELLDPSGSRVTSFGTNGCGPGVGFPESFLTTDAQGRILLAGSRTYCPPCGKDTVMRVEADVARLLPNGSRDPAFGQKGVVGTHANLGVESSAFEDFTPKSLGATADAGVVLGVSGELFRLEEGGAPEQSYGSGGVVETHGAVESLVVEADGSTVLAISDSKHGAYLRKLTPTGAPDPSFGKGGTATLPLRTDTHLETIAPFPGGGYLIGGDMAPAQDCHKPCAAAPFLARVTASGQPDPTYGKRGVALLHLPVPRRHWTAAVQGLLVGSDGSAVVVGNDAGRDAYASAWTSTGAPLTSFGKAGAIVEQHHEQAGRTRL